MISQTEENYLKAIYKICENTNKSASTNSIAGEMETSAASVTDMVKRLSEKELIVYQRYKGVTLSEKGNEIATNLIRKHRLWEVFLVDKLNFSWDEVHEIAEQLEHIQSQELVTRLDGFLGHPKFDPHGDPIPDSEGNFTFRKQVLLSDLPLFKQCVVVGVQEHSTPFLQYLDKVNLGLGATIQVIEKFEFDESLKIILGDASEIIISSKVSQNLFVQEQS